MQAIGSTRAQRSCWPCLGRDPEDLISSSISGAVLFILMVWWWGRSAPWLPTPALFQARGPTHSPSPENTAHRDKAPILMRHLEAKFQQTPAASQETFNLLLDLMSDTLCLCQPGEPLWLLHVMLEDFEPPFSCNGREEIPGEEHRRDNHTMAGFQESMAQGSKGTRNQELYFPDKSSSKSQDTTTAPGHHMHHEYDETHLRVTCCATQRSESKMS